MARECRQERGENGGKGQLRSGFYPVNSNLSAIPFQKEETRGAEKIAEIGDCRDEEPQTARTHSKLSFIMWVDEIKSLVNYCISAFGSCLPETFNGCTRTLYIEQLSYFPIRFSCKLEQAFV